jgi:hypothetical protein
MNVPHISTCVHLPSQTVTRSSNRLHKLKGKQIIKRDILFYVILNYLFTCSRQCLAMLPMLAWNSLCSSVCKTECFNMPFFETQKPHTKQRILIVFLPYFRKYSISSHKEASIIPKYHYLMGCSF